MKEPFGRLLADGDRDEDMLDIERLLATADVNIDRVRPYFRLFDREAEVDVAFGELDRTPWRGNDFRI